MQKAGADCACSTIRTLTASDLERWAALSLLSLDYTHTHTKEIQRAWKSRQPLKPYRFYMNYH